MKLPFTKMHGAGNDFVVIDATRTPFVPTPALLQRLTDRRFGVGCDQVLVVEPPHSADVDFNYRIFNADGSEVGQCGNGSRALARFVREQHLSEKTAIRVQTATATLLLQDRGNHQYEVDMGVPRLAPADVPFLAAETSSRYTLTLEDGAQVEVAAVGMGNPHAVLRVDDVDRAPVAELGARIQAHAAFPEGVNVGFLQIVDSAHARLRVYERGVGETLACGSGACAAAVAGQQWGLLGNDVQMQLRGGTLRIQWAGPGHAVRMTGPAETVFTGEIEWPN